LSRIASFAAYEPYRELVCRLMNPPPRRAHHADDRRLRRPERDVDHEPPDLAAEHRLEVFADRADVPVVENGVAGSTTARPALRTREG
jgi:hypothetical protein